MYLRYAAAHQTEPASVFTLDEIVAKSFIQIVMQKGLPLRDHINKKIRQVSPFSNISKSVLTAPNSPDPSSRPATWRR